MDIVEGLFSLFFDKKQKPTVSEAQTPLINPDEEERRIKAAQANVEGRMRNSGGNLEPNPGTGSTRNILDQTAVSTAKQPSYTTREETGA